MKKYKLKPKPPVEAIQWTGENLTEIQKFVGSKNAVIGHGGNLYLSIFIKEKMQPISNARVYIDDWIVRENELVRPVSPIAFADKYEADE